CAPWSKFGCGQKLLLGGFEVALLIKNIAQVIMCVGVLGFECNGPLQFCGSLLWFAVAPEKHAVIIVDQGRFGAEAQGGGILFGGLPFLAAQFKQVTTISMKIARLRIDAQSLVKMLLSLVEFALPQENG